MSLLIYVIIAAVSFTSMIFELLQTRILSFVFWSDVVYLTVSMAMLGFGISGSLVAIFNKKIVDRNLLLSRLLSMFGISMVLAAFGTADMQLFWVFASASFKILNYHQILSIQLIFCYVVFMLPFVFAGAAISIILTSPNYKVAKLYAVDLISAACGAALFFFLLPVLGPETLIGFMCTLVSLLGFYLSKMIGKPSKLSIVVAIIGLIVGCAKVIEFVPEPYKEMAYEAYGTRNGIERTVWTPLCRIDIVGSNKRDLDYFPGVYPPRSFKVIYQDGAALTRLLSRSAILETFKRANEYKATKKASRIIADGSFFYAIKPKPTVMIIGVGGRADIVNALAFDAKKIYGAEINPATYSLPIKYYSDYTGPFFDDPRISLINAEGRSALRKFREPMDVIVLNGIDTFAALNAGAYVLSENYLYTVEAFDELFSHLNKDGLIAFGRWNTQPPRESLRLTSLACESFKRAGSKTIDKQIFIFGFPSTKNGKRLFTKVGEEVASGWAMSLFKKNPFTQAEVKTLMDIANQQGIKILYCPKVFDSITQQNIESRYAADNSLDQDYIPNCKCFNDLVIAYSKGEQANYFSTYPYEISPTTDDSPFFFEYPQKDKLGLPNLAQLRQTSAGAAICVVLGEALLFSLLAIFWPLWRYQKIGINIVHAPQFSLYFGAIGMGFMLLEIALMQKFVLFLGSPLYALPVVLISLLLGAGVGSACISSLTWSWQKIIVIFGSSLIIFMSLIIFGVSNLFYSLLQLELASRMFIAFMVLFPAGFFMGSFFPSGLDMVKRYNSEYIPWAWGINGCTSVIGSIIAIAVAMAWGFTSSLIAGVICYVIACLSAYAISRKTNSSTAIN